MNLRWTPEQLARAGTALIVLLGAFVSVRLFQAIDGASHSVSDTLLGFVPNDIAIWAVALAAVWLVRRAAGPRRR